MNKSVFRFALSAMLLVLIYALCSSTHAQQPANVPRIGFLIPGTQAAFSVRTDAIRQGLRDLGYLEGKNLVIEFRYNDGKVGRLPELAAELAHLKVEVIFAVGSDAAQAAKSVTKTIPIVATAADPVGTKLVASQAETSLGSPSSVRSCPASDSSCSRRRFPRFLASQ